MSVCLSVVPAETCPAAHALLPDEAAPGLCFRFAHTVPFVTGPSSLSACSLRVTVLTAQQQEQRGPEPGAGVPRGEASRVARRPAEHSVLVEPAHGVFFSCYHFCGTVFTVSGELRVCSSKCKIINWLPLESVQRHIQVLRGPEAYPIWAQSLKNAYAITETKLGTRPREEPLRLLGPAAYSSLVSGNSASICNCRSLISREAVLESARGWPWSSRESHAPATAVGQLTASHTEAAHGSSEISSQEQRRSREPQMSSLYFLMRCSPPSALCVFICKGPLLPARDAGGICLLAVGNGAGKLSVSVCVVVLNILNGPLPITASFIQLLII